MDNLDMPSKMHRVFAALEAYGCDNIDELLALTATDEPADTVDFMSWDDLADHIIKVLRGQAHHLNDEADRLAQQYRSKAARINFILDKGPL